MIFTYHEIVPEPAPYVYSMDAAMLRRHLAYLAATDRTSPLDGDYQVTFDDGHASQYKYGLPPLQETMVRATFFVTVSWIGTRAEYMDWPQLAELVDGGHRVQSHGWSHSLLTRCSPAELEVELGRSKALLEDTLGCAVRAISMPGGRVNATVRRACAAAGYAYVHTSDPWTKPAFRDGVWVLGRAMAKNDYTVEDLHRLRMAEASPLALTRLGPLAKGVLRGVVGDSAYETLWRVIGRKRACSAINLEYQRPQDGREA